MRRLSPLVLLVICLGMVGCDHATKYSAQSLLRGRSPVVLVSGVLDLRYLENTDTAFNALRFIPVEVRRAFLKTTGVLMLFILAGLVLFPKRWLARRLAPAERAAAFFALAGAGGNVSDRVLRGYVVDFIHIHYWPVFNFADVYLAVAVGLVLLSGLRPRPVLAPRP